MPSFDREALRSRVPAHRPVLDREDRRAQTPTHRKAVTRRPAPKKEPSLLGRATRAVADVAERSWEAVSEAPVDLRSLTTGGRVRRGPKVKDVAHQLGELSGVNSVRRIRAGEGGAGDWLTVGSMAAGPVGRGAVLAARAPRQLGIVSPDMAKTIANAGYTGVKVKKPTPDMRPRTRINELGFRPMAGAQTLPRGGEQSLKRGGIYRVPAERTGDNEYMGNRMHWLVDADNDMVFIGEPGQIHADIYEMLAERGILRQPGSLGQGFLSASRTGSEAAERGTRTRDYSVLVGGSRRTPASNRWLQYLTRNLDIADEDIDLGMDRVGAGVFPHMSGVSSAWIEKYIGSSPGALDRWNEQLADWGMEQIRRRPRR